MEHHSNEEEEEEEGANLVVPDSRSWNLSPSEQQRGPASPRSEDRESPREGRWISSAREDFSEVLEDFRAEDFFSAQHSLLQLYVAPPRPGSDKQPHAKISSKEDKAKKHKVRAAPSLAKPMSIPRSLQDTPYFAHYEKHTHQSGNKPQLAASVSGAARFAAEAGLQGEEKDSELDEELPLSLQRK